MFVVKHTLLCRMRTFGRLQCICIPVRFWQAAGWLLGLHPWSFLYKALVKSNPMMCTYWEHCKLVTQSNELPRKCHLCLSENDIYVPIRTLAHCSLKKHSTAFLLLIQNAAHCLQYTCTHRCVIHRCVFWRGKKKRRKICRPGRYTPISA